LFDGLATDLRTSRSEITNTGLARVVRTISISAASETFSSVRQPVKQMLLHKKEQNQSPSHRATWTSSWACVGSATARPRSESCWSGHRARLDGSGRRAADDEAAVVPGKGKLQHTGQLGEVMQESIQAAMTVVRSRASILGLEQEFYQKLDVHLHIPEGATPKDGLVPALECVRRWSLR